MVGFIHSAHSNVAHKASSRLVAVPPARFDAKDMSIKYGTGKDIGAASLSDKSTAYTHHVAPLHPNHVVLYLMHVLHRGLQTGPLGCLLDLFFLLTF